MAYNYTMTINDAGADEQIIAQTVCEEIVVGEDEGVTNWPTVDWKFKSPGATLYTTKAAGTKQVFKRPNRKFFTPGEVVADVAVVSGSSTFSVVEQ